MFSYLCLDVEKYFISSVKKMAKLLGFMQQWLFLDPAP